MAEDGEAALAFLRREGDYADAPSPDLILLDLNLPKKDGREVLADIKSDESLKHIPVVVLTTSQAEEDILRAYKLAANCYIAKPVDFRQFMRVVTSIRTSGSVWSAAEAAGSRGILASSSGARRKVRSGSTREGSSC